MSSRVQELAPEVAGGLVLGEQTVLAPAPRPGQLQLSDEQNAVIDAVVRGQNVLVEACIGSGKALVDTDRVPTPTGWRKVGEIAVGDQLFGRDGRPTEVLGVFPQGFERVYRVTFSDGRSVRCSADHNWSVRRTSRRTRELETLTTRELMDRGLCLRNGCSGHGNGQAGHFFTARFKAPVHEAVHMVRRELPVHPYVVGAFLGDGCCTERDLTLSSPDAEIPTKVAGLLGATVRRRSANNYSWDFFGADGARLRTAEVFAELPELVCYSYGKRIPEAYLLGDLDQRAELARGLMDTDGSIASSGGRYTVRFSSTSVELAAQVKDLLGSLGHVVAWHEDARAHKYTSGRCIELVVKTANAAKASLFSAGPKLELARRAAGAPQRRTAYDEVSISAIEDLGHSEPMTCFSVAADDSLFLCEDYVVTHNTSTIQRLCEVMSPSMNILYLTYSRLLKADAQSRVGAARVQNYHGVVYPHLLAAGLGSVGIDESIRTFNAHFRDLSADFPRYDLLVVDEYQDINSEYAQLLENVRSVNPRMQVVLVGDMAQKVQSNTTLDVQAWARSFVGPDAAMLGFSQSFRMGPTMGKVLGQAWGKTITGANAGQRVRFLSHREAIELICATEPSDLLCLGKRNGPMNHALNQAETLAPDKYNKSTVFASIKDGDSGMSPSADAAVFTTFDSSKGMERPVCLVFDYDEKTWDMRGRFPDVDHEILRNVFLVAASRGKDDLVFVRPTAVADEPEPDLSESVGQIPVERFVRLRERLRPQYEMPFKVASAFDFTYAEDVVEALGTISRTRLDDGSGSEIAIERADGLIDLSPAVGKYQEALFFEDFDAKAEMAMMIRHDSFDARSLIVDIEDEGDPWKNCLLLTAASTSQQRYTTQVSRTVPAEAAQALKRRLGSRLDPACGSQVELVVSGTAWHGRSATSELVLAGIADAIHQGQVFELKFVTALDNSMFLQVACYVAMAQELGMDVRSGVLWNTRTDEAWEVSVPDRERFFNAAVKCMTKQSYDSFTRG